MIIPPGFARLSPYMLAQDAKRLLLFLTQAFDAELVEQSLRPDGTIANAQVKIEECMFMLADVPTGFQAMPASYYLYVENADATMAKALAAGAEQIMPVADMPYGDRQGGVKDPVGNLWWISERRQACGYQDW